MKIFWRLGQGFALFNIMILLLMQMEAWKMGERLHPALQDNFLIWGLIMVVATSKLEAFKDSKLQ